VPSFDLNECKINNKNIGFSFLPEAVSALLQITDFRPFGDRKQTFSVAHSV